jgi:hypothetical protein
LQFDWSRTKVYPLGLHARSQWSKRQHLLKCSNGNIICEFWCQEWPVGESLSTTLMEIQTFLERTNSSFQICTNSTISIL